jgi:hypothetical protein
MDFASNRLGTEFAECPHGFHLPAMPDIAIDSGIRWCWVTVGSTVATLIPAAVLSAAAEILRAYPADDVKPETRKTP